MGETQIYLHPGLLDSMPTKGKQRDHIMRFIRSLRDDPNHAGDFVDRDETQRTRQIKIVGDYAVTYWHDAAVNIVMVVDVRHADR